MTPPSVPSLAGLRGLYAIAGPLAKGDLHSRQQETVRLAEALLASGARILQLRDKWSDGRSLLETARALHRMTRAAGCLLVVNDRLDVALLAEADGVHLGQDDLPIDDARRAVAQLARPPERFLVGVSTHDLAQVEEALRMGADYLGFGPIYATTSKSDALFPRGPGLLAEAVQLAGAVPVVAIGGITLGRLDEIAGTGVPLAAVIGDIAHAADPAAQARAIHQRLLG